MDLEKDRSGTRIVHSALDVKSWMARLPSCEEARPGRCPACEAPSRPAGGRVQLWGHGLRTRQVRGPLAPGEVPVLVTVDGRRYQCQPCGAVVIVEPRSVLRYRHFSGSAIAMALALCGIDVLPAAEVRRRVSPWRTIGHAACRGWITLKRWIDVARGGRLLPGARHRVAGDDRAVASRVAHAVAARAPPPWEAPIAARAFAGAALAA